MFLFSRMTDEQFSTLYYNLIFKDTFIFLFVFGGQKYFYFHRQKSPVQLGCAIFVRNTSKIWDLLVRKNQSLHKCKLIIYFSCIFLSFGMKNKWS